MDVRIKAVLDIRRALASGLFRVKVRIIHNRKAYYLPTAFDFSKEQFSKIMSDYARDRNKYMRNQIESEVAKVRDIVLSLEGFDIHMVKRIYSEKEDQNISLVDYTMQLVEDLHRQNRIRYAHSFSNAVRSWSVHDKQVNWKSINARWLEDYETAMIEKGLSATSIGIYLRALRRVINDGIEKGYFDQKNYPFGRRKYQIPAGRNIKKAMTKDEIKKFWKYQPKLPLHQRAKDLFFFSYFCQGVNMTNILRLKNSDIKDGNIVFTRKKTERSTKANSRPIVVPVTEEVKEIMQRYKNRSIYIFPWLEGKKTEQDKVREIQNVSRHVNKVLKKLHQKIGISKFTFVSARHSWATMMKNSGAPIKYISEGLGHSNVLTTENYLASFNDKQAAEFNRMATDFLKS